MHEIIRIQSAELIAEIALDGAELKSLHRCGEENVIWQMDEAFWNRSAPILFPIVGRLKDNQYEWKSENYQMFQHGFARNQRFEIIEKEDSLAIFQIKSNVQTKSQYPFDFILNIKYELIGNQLLVAYTVVNQSDESLPFSIGGHPGFQLNGKLEEYHLRFPEKFITHNHLIDNGLYNGEKELLSVDKVFKLKNEYFQKDAIVFKQPSFNEVHLCKSDKSVLAVRCHDWSAVGFWTKPGAPFFCIEPWWGWADDTDASGKLTDKKGLIWLEAGKRKEFQFDIQVH
jgi:galactose mutarotase-like enzyme